MYILIFQNLYVVLISFDTQKGGLIILKPPESNSTEDFFEYLHLFLLISLSLKNCDVISSC